MATIPPFRFSMGRLMLEVGLMALPLGLFGNGLRGSELGFSMVTFIILIAAWLVALMEVTYWFFLRPTILEPIYRRFVAARGRDRPAP
jgi:hypothetical protein